MQESAPASMSIVFLHPVFDALLSRGKTRKELATQLNVSGEVLYESSVILSANNVYSFLSWSTECLGEPLFSARIGQGMAKGGWAPLVPLMIEARTVGDFFQKFSQIASDQGGAASYRLEVEGPVTMWRLTRPAGANKDAAHADAVAVGFFVQILKSAAQNDWVPTDVVAVLPDTSLVPRDLLPSTSVMPGRIGLTLRFPSAFLGFDMPPVKKPDNLPDLDLPEPLEVKFLDRVQKIIKERISEPGLSVDDIATGIGLPTWKLQSWLRKEGTSVSEIKEGIRRYQAIERVFHTNDTVTSIASSLGYTNGSNFTRAFRSWTGKSPRESRGN